MSSPIKNWAKYTRTGTTHNPDREFKSNSNVGCAEAGQDMSIPAPNSYYIFRVANLAKPKPNTHGLSSNNSK